MRRLFLLVLMIATVAFLALVSPGRWRYDHITVGTDSYLVRIDRLSGHVDILVPEQGWTAAEDPWDAGAPPEGDRHSSAGPS